jgi:hypothetical protein
MKVKGNISQLNISGSISQKNVYGTIAQGGYVNLFPSVITDNSPGWWIADDLSTITKDGAERMSEWRDFLGSGHDLLQATGADQPLWSATGILFDGISEFMKAVPFVLVQPEIIYIVFRQITWAGSKHIFDGNATDSGALLQGLGSPDLYINSGTPGVGGGVDLVLNTFGIVRIIFNGVNGSIQINEVVPITGNAGALNMGGFTLGARGDITRWSHIEVKEVGIMPGDMGEADIYNYLDNKYGPF